MAGEIELGFTISKQAMVLVNAGKAMLSSGGVRELSGELIEMAKPIAKNASGFSNAISGLNLASSAAGNVQMGVLQHSMNVANRKLTTVVKNLDLLQNSMGTVTSLSWLNCAMGMVNCGISVVGFKMTLDRLSEVKDQIQGLSCKIDNEIVRGLRKKFREYYLLISGDMDTLEKYEINAGIEMTINEHFASIISYLEDVIDRFEKKEIDGVLGCNIIFNLSTAFCQEVNAYAAQYYYKNNKLPPHYNDWIAVVERIDSEAFRNHLKQYLLFDTDLTMEQRYVAFDGAMFTIEDKLVEMDYNKELFLHLPLEQYKEPEKVLLEQFNNGNAVESNGQYYIPLAKYSV